MEMYTSFLRRLFRVLNKFMMVPIFRLGLGPIVGNPLTGYIMVLKTTGRKTGKTRYTPVNYGIFEGDVFCLAGWGQISDWFRNIKANPKIEVIHPDGPLAGVVDEVTDARKRIFIIRLIMKNAGFAAFLEGYNPFKLSDEELEAKLGGLPVLRIHPTGLGNGAADPAGWLWLLTLAFSVLLIYILIRLF